MAAAARNVSIFPFGGRPAGPESRTLHPAPDYETVTRALHAVGSAGGADEAHGTLCALVCAQGARAEPSWLAVTIDDEAGPPAGGETPASDAERAASLALLRALFARTERDLRRGDLAFALMLPDDDEPVAVRARSLAHWAQGFLHGLGVAAGGTGLEARLERAPLAEIVQDFGEITKAVAGGGDGDAETDEAAYAELYEYLRVSLQLVYEELAELRKAGAAPRPTR